MDDRMNGCNKLKWMNAYRVARLSLISPPLRTFANYFGIALKRYAAAWLSIMHNVSMDDELTAICISYIICAITIYYTARQWRLSPIIVFHLLDEQEDQYQFSSSASKSWSCRTDRAKSCKKSSSRSPARYSKFQGLAIYTRYIHIYC